MVLTAIGCDLAQGPALSQVLPIDSLNMPQPVTVEAGKPGLARVGGGEHVAAEREIVVRAPLEAVR